MKLIKCYVENFGKLSNFTYNFKDGLNIIKEQNGFGKTTFAVFIKSMFYGMDAGKNTKIEKSERKKYYPWQGGNYGGNIEFEVDGNKYKIERFFGKKPAEDTFKLYDLATNLESKDFTENIGEEIFKINKEGYERSTYIPQGQIQIEMEDSINAKLGNVLESDNDVNSSEQAIIAINNAKKLYKKERGKGGLIDEKKEKLNQLERELEKRQSDFEILKIQEEKLNKLNNNIKEQGKLRDQSQQMLSEKMEQGRKVAKLETYKTILTKYNKSQENIDELTEFFANDIPSDDLIKNLTEKNFELEITKNQLKNNKFSVEDQEKVTYYKDIFDRNQITETQVNKGIEEYSKISNLENEIQNKTNKKEIIQNELKSKRLATILDSILAIVFIILGFFLIFKGVQEIVGFISAIIGIGLFILFLVNLKKSKKLDVKELEEKIEEMQSEKKLIERNIDKILDICNEKEQNKLNGLYNIKNQINSYNNLLRKQNDINANVQKNNIKKATLENEIKNGLTKYFVDLTKPYSELLQELTIKKNEYQSQLEQFNSLKKEKEDFEKSNDMQNLDDVKDLSNIDESVLKEKIKEINIHFDKLSDEKNQVKNQIEVLENRIDEYEFLESDIENTASEIEEETEKYKILNTTESLLKQAKEQFSSSYLQDMIQNFNEYMKLIDNGEMSTNIDIKLDVKVDVNGSQKEIKYFSAGYKDLVYICMRFSLIKTLFKNEAPFVVLDDPFVNLDEEKTTKAINVISTISEKYQIIYFVCNSSRI